MDPGGVDWVLPEGRPEQRKRVVCNGLAIQFLGCKSRVNNFKTISAFIVSHFLLSTYSPNRRLNTEKKLSTMFLFPSPISCLYFFIPKPLIFLTAASLALSSLTFDPFLGIIPVDIPFSFSLLKIL